MSLKSQIRLITIDLDDTLWPCMPTITNAETQLYQWMQQQLPKITARYSMLDLRDKRRDLMYRCPELINDMSEARRTHLRQLSDEFNYPHDWIEEGFGVFLESRQLVEFFDDVLPVLEILAQHYKLAALTNGNADIQKVGLGNYFVSQISAADVAAAKPNPAMFLKAMKQFKVTPEQVLHIGDHPIHDIFGAQVAGVRSVWVNRTQSDWNETDFKADFEISNLHGLLTLLT